MERCIAKRVLVFGLCCILFSMTSSLSFAQSVSNSDAVVFSPANTVLDNPTTSAGTTSSSQFTIQVNAFDSKGKALTPSKSNPLFLNVYGAPDGVISPTIVELTSGTSATFTYNGDFFPNNIVINGWIADKTGKGDALGVTQVLQKSQPTACAGTEDYSVPLKQTLPDSLKIDAAVGYTTPDTGKAHVKEFTIDTGSLGVVITTDDLAKATDKTSSVIGPGGPGVKCYDSSNKAYFGHYYLAPVDIEVTQGSSTTTVQTNPIIVLGADEYCKVSNCTALTKTHCRKNSPIHYMGVGFNRNVTAPGDLFDSPAENAFLHVAGSSNGVDINPGYILSPSDKTTDTGVTLGINSLTGYIPITLTANTNVPGDWNAQPACYGFPDLPATNHFCGTALLDVGITEMFIDLPFKDRPAGTFEKNDKVPAGLTMKVEMGNDPANPAMTYQYTTVLPPTAPTDAAPTYSQWIDTTKTGSVFVNTGRNPLNSFDYLYAGQCGIVAFKKLP